MDTNSSTQQKKIITKIKKLHGGLSLYKGEIIHLELPIQLQIVFKKIILLHKSINCCADTQ